MRRPKHHLSLTIPDEVLRALDLSAEGAAHEIRLAGAVKLHELGRLSSGVAAMLAGVPRTVFLGLLADYGVDTFRLSPEEIAADSETA